MNNKQLFQLKTHPIAWLIFGFFHFGIPMGGKGLLFVKINHLFMSFPVYSKRGFLSCV
jgi:hypothetical protein